MSHNGLFQATGFSHVHYMADGVMFVEPIDDLKLEYSESQCRINGRIVDDHAYFKVFDFLSDRGFILDAVPNARKKKA